MELLQPAYIVDDLNILLVGETGVGKSTFINAFANYLKYDKFQAAERGEAVCLVPAKFEVTDENFELKTIQIGSCVNESEVVGESATQQAKSYVFPIARFKTRIRLIDTPGVGDTRGVDQDALNFLNIVNYVGKLDRLHAICFLIKPNNARLTIVFKYCVKQLLSVLEKSACANMIFVFTNTRNTLYKPGDTLPALRKVLDEINLTSKMEIKFDKDNVFCLDNEAFRFLVSCKHNINFPEEDRKSFADSWEQSASECWRLIRYVTTRCRLSPHLTEKTISVNRARNVILQLSKPLADIADLISDNIALVQKFKNCLRKEESVIKDLEGRLYIPQVDLEIVPLQHPVTICTNFKCCEIYTKFSTLDGVRFRPEEFDKTKRFIFKETASEVTVIGARIQNHRRELVDFQAQDFKCNSKNSEEQQKSFADS